MGLCYIEQGIKYTSLIVSFLSEETGLVVGIVVSKKTCGVVDFSYVHMTTARCNQESTGLQRSLFKCYHVMAFMIWKNCSSL